MTARSFKLALFASAIVAVAACTIPQQSANTQGTTNTVTNNAAGNGTE